MYCGCDIAMDADPAYPRDLLTGKKGSQCFTWDRASESQKPFNITWDTYWQYSNI